VRVPPEALDEWRRETEAIYPVMRGAMIPAAAFDEVLRLRNDYRDATDPPPAPAP
jgi:hypothetical protein